MLRFDTQEKVRGVSFLDMKRNHKIQVHELKDLELGFPISSVGEHCYSTNTLHREQNFWDCFVVYFSMYMPGHNNYAVSLSAVKVPEDDITVDRCGRAVIKCMCEHCDVDVPLYNDKGQVRPIGVFSLDMDHVIAAMFHNISIETGVPIEEFERSNDYKT